MTQANAIAKGLKATLKIPEQFTGMALMVLVAGVILGGVQRVAMVAEKIVRLWRHSIFWEVSCHCDTL